jgi:putative nucleotidyltransferase with HDIG domain
MALKRIPIGALKVGMYVAGLDRSWVSTPFFRHRFSIKTESQVLRIRQSGAREITIDTRKGIDVDPDVVATMAPDQHETHEPAPVAESEVAVSALEEAGTGSGHSLANEFVEARQARQDMLNAVRAVFAWVRTEERIDRGQVLETTEKLIGNVLKHHDAFLALIRTREFHPELLEHALNVSTLAVILGQALELSPAQLQRLAMGALLHDIGLLRVPANVLKKQGGLTATERTLYERHPSLGTAILEKTGGFDDDVLTAVQEHHATLDGSGYPAEVSPQATSRTSRIVMVADVYDELLSGQQDGHLMTPADALARMYREAQRHRYDQELVSVLISQIGVYPLFGLVELDSGERAIVVRVIPGQLLEPVLLVVTASDRMPLAEPRVLDLAVHEGGEPVRKITRLLDAKREGVQIEDLLAKAEGTLHPAVS